MPGYEVFDDFTWRKGWDSNPRGAYTPGGFQDRCLKPLGHPSPVTTSNTYDWRWQNKPHIAASLPPPVPGRAHAGYIWARLILNERRTPPESASHWQQID